MMTFILICLGLMLVLNIFSSYIPFLNYLDEFIPFVLMLIYLVKQIQSGFSKKIEGKKFILVILLLLLFIIGLYADIKYKYFNGSVVIVKDMIAFYKMFITILSLDYLIKEIPKRKFEKFLTFCYVYVGIMFACLVLNFIPGINIFSSGEYRHGIKTYQFLFTHPTFLVASTVPLLMFIHLSKRKHRKLFIFFTILITLSSLRTKGVVIVLIYIALLLYQKLKKCFTKPSFQLVKGVVYAFAFVAIYVATSVKITQYLAYGIAAARPALYMVGFQIMKENAPIGSGFGTFASSLSGEYYSIVYTKYNISHVTGLTPEKYNYMADTFWPYVYGQFGIAGLIFYIGALAICCSIILKKCKNKETKACVFLLMSYLLFASFVESIMTNDSIILYILSIYVFISYDLHLTKNRLKEKKE